MNIIPSCNCADLEFTIQNMGGFDQCKGGIGLAKDAIFSSAVRIEDESVNGLNFATQAPNAAFFDAQFANPVIADRWFRLKGIKQFAAPVVAPNTEDIDGEIYFLSENGKQVTWVVVSKEANKMKAKIDSIVNCRGNVLVSFIDSFKGWVGEATATDFTGRLMQKGSYYSQVQDATKDAVQRLIITFNWDPSALEGSVQYVPKSAMEGYDLSKDIIDLIDGRITYGTSLLAGIDFKVYSDIGGVNTLGSTNRLPLGGLTETEMIAWDVDGEAEIPGTMSEPSLGSYVFTYTAPILAGVTVSIRPADWATGDYLEKSYDLKDLSQTNAPSVSA